MTSVTVLTAERMLEIEANSIVGGSVVGSNLILEKFNGTTIDAGVVVVDPTPLPYVVSLMVSDPAGSDLSIGDGKAYFRVSDKMNDMHLSAVAAHVVEPSSSGLPTFQVHNVTVTVDMLTTKVSVDVGENDSVDATTPAVIDEDNHVVNTGQLLRIDCDIAGTDTVGAFVELQFSA